MNRTRSLVAVALALTMVAGGGAALAATGSSNPASDFLGDVADRLGIGRDKLESAIEDATIARIEAAVAAGDLSKEEGERLKERVRSGEGPVFPPTFRAPGFGDGPLEGPRMLAPGFLGADLLGAAADYLGKTKAEVREALGDGKSLGEIAEDEGKSVDGLKEALRSAVREDADEAVEDGDLTREEADRVVEKLSRLVDELVEKGGFPLLGPGLARPGFGPGLLGPPKPLHGFLPGIDVMDRAADYLGMDGDDLREALRDGKSLAEIAKDKGKSVDGLKRALRDAIRADADQAVEDGDLTREEADRFAEKLGNAVDDLVEGERFEFRFHSGPRDGDPA